MASSVQDRISSAVEGMIRRQKELQKEMEASTMMLKIIAQTMEKERKQKKVEELEKLMLEVIEKSHEVECHTDALKNLPRLYLSHQEGASETDFQSMITSELREISTNNAIQPENHPLFKVFKEAVWTVHHAGQPMPGQEEDEMVMTSTFVGTLNATCPLTLKAVTQLDDPVCGTSCRHVYDKNAIMQHIQKHRNQASQCPIAGCPRTLTMDDIVCDARLRMEIREMRYNTAATHTNEDYTELE